MISSTIDSGNPDNTASKTGRQKVKVRITAMVERYNMFMKGTNLLDQKTTVYAYNQKSPGKLYCIPFWDYINIRIVNSFVVYEEIVQSKSHKIKEDKIFKTQKDFKRGVANGLIRNLLSSKKDCLKTQAGLRIEDIELRMQKSMDVVIGAMFKIS